VDLSKTEFDYPFFVSMTGLVLLAFTTQNFITKAMMMKKPSYIMPFGYVSIICSVISDFLIFGTNFNVLTIFGMFLTSCGLLVKLIIPEEAHKNIYPKFVTEKIKGPN
jgi:drug/metabolite transporter (DMT)-like permease